MADRGHSTLVDDDAYTAALSPGGMATGEELKEQGPSDEGPAPPELRDLEQGVPEIQEPTHRPSITGSLTHTTGEWVLARTAPRSVLPDRRFIWGSWKLIVI
jgi:hypothetical protein